MTDPGCYPGHYDGDGCTFPTPGHLLPAPAPRCACSHGPSTHTGGFGQCWISVCCCEQYRDPQEKK